ncbi:hypothetical protein DL96DRAFT_1615374 [Flagelloscypha sp. PMI_526]|nr:hypothetical protein DL96DRAFT_1615374 [Flagelloscypha sp. PMI_526]
MKTINSQPAQILSVFGRSFPSTVDFASTLLPDILEIIFLFHRAQVLEDYESYTIKYNLHVHSTPNGEFSAIPWLAPSQVCNHWRTTALRCASLWNTLLLNNPSATKELLRRSGTATLIATYKCRYNFVTDGWWRISFEERAHTSFLQLLPHLDRVAVLDLRILDIISSYITPEMQLSLCELVVYLNYWADMTWPATHLIRSIIARFHPSLKILDVRNSSSKWFWGDIQAPLLTQLKVGADSEDFDLAAFGNALKYFSNLTILQLSVTKSAIHLPLLEELEIGSSPECLALSESISASPHFFAIRCFDISLRLPEDLNHIAGISKPRFENRPLVSSVTFAFGHTTTIGFRHNRGDSSMSSESPHPPWQSLFEFSSISLSQFQATFGAVNAYTKANKVHIVFKGLSLNSDDKYFVQEISKFPCLIELDVVFECYVSSLQLLHLFQGFRSISFSAPFPVLRSLTLTGAPFFTATSPGLQWFEDTGGSMEHFDRCSSIEEGARPQLLPMLLAARREVKAPIVSLTLRRCRGLSGKMLRSLEGLVEELTVEKCTP